MAQEELKAEFRTHIFEAIKNFQLKALDGVAVSEVLVELGFGIRDCKGGEDDTMYATLCIRELADREAKRRIPNFTAQKFETWEKRHRKHVGEKP